MIKCTITYRDEFYAEIEAANRLDAIDKFMGGDCTYISLELDPSLIRITDQAGIEEE